MACVAAVPAGSPASAALVVMRERLLAGIARRQRLWGACRFLPGYHPPMRVAVASDHAALALKRELCAWLGANGHEVMDLGPHGEDSVDYPDYG